MSETGRTPVGDGDLLDQIDALAARIGTYRSAGDPEAADPDVLLAELELAHEELRIADEEVRAQQEELALVLRSQLDARDRFRALLPVAVVTTDRHGLIQTANAAASALIGAEVDRIVRRPIFGFVAPDERRDLRNALSRALPSGGELRQLTTLIARGAPRSVELAAIVGSGQTGTPEVTWVLLPSSVEGGRADEPAGVRLARALVELTQLRQADSTDHQVMTEVAGICQRALPGQNAVSISLGEPGAPSLVATDSKLAQTADGAQIQTGEGPSTAAFGQAEIVVVSDARSDERWPRFGAAVADTDLSSVVALPLRVGDEVVGTLNLYSRGHGLTDDATVQSAELLSAAVSAILHQSEVKAELEALTRQLETALESRATIDWAKGILMARHGCTPDEAFQLLARASSRSNIKLRELARRLVEDVGRSQRAT